MSSRASNMSLLMGGLPLNQAKIFIQSADLTPIIERLIHTNKWSRKNALAAIEQYRHFTYLKKKYGDQHALPPSHEIDEVWHTHILHTREYQEFCITIFGQLLHHHPQLEKQSIRNQFRELFETTQRLYQTEFGDYIYAIVQVSPIRKLCQGLAEKLKRPQSATKLT